MSVYQLTTFYFLHVHRCITLLLVTSAQMITLTSYNAQILHFST